MKRRAGRLPKKGNNKTANSTTTAINSIDILQGSFGCAGCTSHYEPDPYWNDERPWSEAARGDGMSYCGVVETVTRESGETDEAFEMRARQRAYELEEADGMPQMCRQYGR